MEDLDPAAWEDVVDFAEEAESIDADRKAHQAYESWLSNGSGSLPEESVLQQGTSALEDWLAASSGNDSVSGRPTLRIGAASALLLGIASLALGFFVNPILYTTVLIPGLLLLYAYVATQSDADGVDSQATHRDRFQNLDLESPASWTSDAVHSRLNELYEQLAEVKLDEKRDEHRKAVSPDLEDLESRESALEERRQELIEAYGVAPATSDIELVAITKGIIRWQEANEEVEGRNAQIDEVESNIEDKQERLEEDLSPYGYGSVDDHSIATEYIRDLDKRWTTHREATEARDRAKDTIGSAEETIDEVTADRAAVYQDLDLEPGAQDELQSLCDQVDQYEEVKTRVNGKKQLRDNELEELKEHPEFDSGLLDATVDELREEKEAAEETAAERDALQKTVTEIELNVDNAKGEYDLEEAIEDRQRALDALEDRLFDDASKMVGDVLVDHLQGTESGGRPEVFDRARGLLLKITRGRYKLDLKDGDFRAYDTVKERGFGLDEFSSGSKLQVLLAVRIAFVEQQESGVKLPLFLDETLANSDDNRAEVIIESVMELARDGRQVCYFTAQGDEVAKWRRELESTDEVEYREIDLAETQPNATAVSIPDTDELAVDSRELPDPAAHDHESYGEELDIPEFSPRQGAGAAHVWHVVDDTEVLHRLLRLGIERWGQLESLLEQGDESVLTEDDETLRRIRLNGAAMNEFVRSWQIGRGEPMDRQALEDTGAVSHRFIDDVSELARDVNGDAEAILAKLRESAVSGFRSNKIDELEAYFKDNGYIQQREPLEPATIRSRIINRLTEEGMTRDEAFERAEQLLQRLSNPPR